MNGVLREERENDIRLRIQLSHIRMATSLALTGGELTNVICLCIPIEDPESLNSIPDKVRLSESLDAYTLTHLLSGSL